MTPTGHTAAAARPRIGTSGDHESAWIAVLIASCVAVVITTWAWPAAPPRPAVTLWFLLVCPGMALARLLPDRGLLTRIVLAVAASLAIDLLIAEFMVETGAWSPDAALGVLIGLVAAAIVVRRRRDRAAPPHPQGGEPWS